MTVFSMLRRQANNPINNSLDKLQITSDLEGSTISLFGVENDLNSFEEILTNSIKENTMKISPEEQAALDESIWKEFSRAVFIRYAGLLYLQPAEDKSSINLVAPAEDFNDILEQVTEHIQKNSFKELSVGLEIDQTRSVVRWMRLEERYPRIKVAVNDMGIKLTGPPDDFVDIEKDLDSFIRNTDTRILNLSKGFMTVFQMLQIQPNSQFRNAVEKLKITTITGDENVTLFGAIDDLDKFEEILTNSIKENTIEISQEEQAAFKENIWEEFYGTLLIRYTGILYLELIENNSAINLVTITKVFYGILEELKRYIKKNARRKVTVEIEESQTRFMVQRMNEDLIDITEDLVRHRVSITSRDNGGFVMTGTEEGLALSQRRFDRLKRKIITDTHIVTTPGMPYYFTQETGNPLFHPWKTK